MSFKDTSAFFIQDQCFFGSYPTQEQIFELEDWGVDVIINLTSDTERKITLYTTKVDVIQLSIPDHGIPKDNIEFCRLVVKLCDMIENGKKIYIHCKAGHGRSGVLVAAILCLKYSITPDDSFYLTTKYHSTRLKHAKRPKMNTYWKAKGSPQTTEQKDFVRLIFHPYKISKICDETKIWFSGKYDNFFLSTYLSPIKGEGGDQFYKYRMSLFRFI